MQSRESLAAWPHLRSRAASGQWIGEEVSSAHQIVGGPFFEDLEAGQIVDSAPAQTLTDGLAAIHTAILGDRLRLPLDAELSRRVTGAPIAHPGLVWDVAIGQSTLLTGRVIANLFYRGLMFRR